MLESPTGLRMRAMLDSAPQRLSRLRRTRARVALRTARPDRRPPRPVKRPRLGRRFDSWLEIGFGVVLALSTVASAWCAFQAQRWAGIQTDLYSQADTARGETLRLNDLAEVQVVELRRRKRHRQEGADEGGREAPEWHVQWLVAGHWRSQ
jgi:hypothetical protein